MAHRLCSSPRQEAPRHRPDVRYGDHERNVFDLWLPDNPSGPVPVHVFFRGGGFVGGDKAGFDPRPFLQAGYAAVSGNYRFVDGTMTFGPTPMHDGASETLQEPEFRARLAATNPWNFVSTEDPPVLLPYNGMPEALVPRLKELGIPHQLRTGANPRGNSVITDWLRKHFD